MGQFADIDAFEKGKAAGQLGPLKDLNPTQRYGIPEEVAAVALFLASGESSYVRTSTCSYLRLWSEC